MLNLLEDVRADRLCVFLQLPQERTLLSMSRRDAARLGEAVVGERLCSVPAVQGGEIRAEQSAGQLNLTWEAPNGPCRVLDTDDLPLHRLILAGALCQGEPGGRVWIVPGVKRTHIGSGVNLLSLQVGTAELLAAPGAGQTQRPALPADGRQGPLRSTGRGRTRLEPVGQGELPIRRPMQVHGLVGEGTINDVSSRHRPSGQKM